MKECAFDNAKINIGKRLVYDKELKKDGEGWYAFVPLDCEIFGHIIVTVEKPHIREITSNNDEILKTLQSMNNGVKFMADVLMEIKNVKRVYIGLLGESDDVHMHYHLLPRYDIKCDEIDDWASEYNFKKGTIEWQKFYSSPTEGFTKFEGFQYLGEIERSYNKKSENGKKPPSEEILEEIACRIKSVIEENKNIIE